MANLRPETVKALLENDAFNQIYDILHTRYMEDILDADSSSVIFLQTKVKVLRELKRDIERLSKEPRRKRTAI